MEVVQTILNLRRQLNKWTLPLGALGIAAVAWHNWRLWQQDKALLAKRSQPEPLPAIEDWSSLPQVSVLVAAWNEAAQIERHIQSFQALRYPYKELILCAGGEDGTYALASRLAGDQVTVLEQQPGEGKQRALRHCLPLAQGDIIFLTDADCELDDEVFERTCYLIAIGMERVCTGGSRPSPELMQNSFVMIQAATQVYHALRAPSYASGLLGRNCAVERMLLEQSGGLDADAPTGTDYVLAKKLVQTGARIRHIPESRIATSYPMSTSKYIRQQNRWLRNIVLHGPRFGAFDEVRASLTTSAIGIGMLLMPIGIIVFGPVLLMAWFSLLVYAFLSRLRYLHVAGIILHQPLKREQIAVQVPIMFLDFFAWSQSLLSYLSTRRRELW